MQDLSSAGLGRAPAADAAPSARHRFLDALRASLRDGSFSKLVLAQARPTAAPGLHRVSVRPVVLRGEACLALVESHDTRDITRNLPQDAALAELDGLIGTAFGQVHLLNTTGELRLMVSRKGRETLVRGKAQAAVAPSGHDREKHRWVDLDRPYLRALGVTDARHQLVPAMSRKWKQINKFIEVLDRAIGASALASRPPAENGAARPVRVADFGSGKGYLTFAVHDHLCHALGLSAQVTGVELRQDLVALCTQAAAEVGAQGLVFEQGDVGSRAPAALDLMIALHACDTATDHAIAHGLRAGASVIVCSPCCHKEIRPQLLSPHPLRPVLRHGVHLGQEAEMLTDALRALMLEASGYDTQVFEFIALEHTAKNKMILAVKRPGGLAASEAERAWREVRELKAFYGLREHCLETLLARRQNETHSVVPAQKPHGL